MKTVKCAVVGAGWWGTTAHVPALKRHPLAELVAVHSCHADKARQVATDFCVPHACATMKEVLAVEGLEAVVISSTPNVHYPQALAALQRGLHVLIEKPMTIKAAESEELVALAEKQGVHFLVSCPWHYTAHSREARRLIQSGALGQLKMISVLMTNFNLGLYRGLSWEEIFGSNPTRQNSARPYFTPGRSSYSDPAVAGGGQIYCQISHVAAHLGFLTERHPVEVFAQFDNADTAVDVYDALNLKLEDGTLASIASTGATPHSERNYEVRVYGTQGALLMELWKGKMECHLFDGQVTRYPDLAEAEIYPLFAPTENLVDLILGRAENGSPARFGLYAMRIIEAACESARTRGNVILRRAKN
ncbi:MAG: Gfo/Idh/MocA family oxidoreductase [Verrucomicrobia bacterium]|nr:Gfo/Idh/MocA family oxidoreductase [Verrucomicrobiota bacterium]